jgi:polynucleotide 5'-hydroxyl-kinase GRC3/NOL9
MSERSLETSITPESDWEVLLSALPKGKGITTLMGATDSGKSTLAGYLVRMFVTQNLSVCLIDADVSQSTLGLPGTICSKTFSCPDDLNA